MISHRKLLQLLYAWMIDIGGERYEYRCDDLLAAWGAHDRPHLHDRSLYQHLHGTRSILEAWKQPLWIQYAGMFYCIYTDRCLRSQRAQKELRLLVRSTIGTRAEKLVYFYSQTPRQWLREPTFGEKGAGDKALSTPTLDAESLHAMGLLSIASYVEAAGPYGSAPASWLSRLSSEIKHLKVRLLGLPASLNDFSLSDQDERKLLSDYDAALGTLHVDSEQATQCLERCSKICPFLFEPWTWKAYVSALRGDFSSARMNATKAEEALQLWPVVWDRRLSHSEWKLAIERLRSATTWVESSDAVLSRVLDRRADEHVRGSYPSFTPESSDQSGEASQYERVIHYFSTTCRDKDGDMCSLYPGLRPRTSYNASSFPIADALNVGFAKIRDEVSRLPNGCFTVIGNRGRISGRMESFGFLDAGRRRRSAFVFCPTIGRILDDFSDVLRSGPGYARLIRLYAHTFLAPHKASTNIGLRAMFPIFAKTGECGIHFEANSVIWTEGKCLIFDSTITHEEWNDSDSECLLLDMTLWNPHISSRDRSIIEKLHVSIERQAFRLYDEWTASDLQRLGKREFEPEAQKADPGAI